MQAIPEIAEEKAVLSHTTTDGDEGIPADIFIEDE